MRTNAKLQESAAGVIPGIMNPSRDSEAGVGRLPTITKRRQELKAPAGFLFSKRPGLQ
jgi:hypothetical protein